MDLSEMRRAYRLLHLDCSDLDPDPIQQFRHWFDEIKGYLLEPNTCLLATATQAGIPSCRAILMKKLDSNGLLFFTNYGSRKGQELDSNPHAAVCFVWIEMERQVRLEGEVTRVSDAVTQDYFSTRPRGSQLGAWASRQSEVIESRQLLEKNYHFYEQQFSGQEIPCPPFWGGYYLQPKLWEFWQGREDRLHDRFRYVKEGAGWKIERLAP